MSEFERTKEHVGGRSILVTSWFDDDHRYWRASAPLYSYLSVLTPKVPLKCETREEAVQRICDLLEGHFEGSK